MAQKKYLSSDRSALFSIENDVDDDEFLRRRPAGNDAGYTSYSNRTASNPSYSSYGNPSNNLEERRLQLLEKKREIEERTVESTKHSIRLLKEAEGAGIATAEVMYPFFVNFLKYL